MRVATAFLALAPLSTPARAEPGFDRVLSAVTLSFADGDADRAVLVDNGDAGADLYLYRALDSSRAMTPAKPALLKKSAAWSGAMFGTTPSLVASAKGSLLVKSENTAIGRSRWSQTLTIVYRNKEFIVAGLTREASDTLEPGSGHTCDLNFLTGKGKRDGKAIETKTPAMKFADWSDEKLPKECNF